MSLTLDRKPQPIVQWTLNSHSHQKQPCRMTSDSAETDLFLYSIILSRGQWILHLRPCSNGLFGRRRRKPSERWVRKGYFSECVVKQGSKIRELPLSSAKVLLHYKITTLWSIYKQLDWTGRVGGSGEREERIELSHILPITLTKILLENISWNCGLVFIHTVSVFDCFILAVWSLSLGVN